MIDWRDEKKYTQSFVEWSVNQIELCVKKSEMNGFVIECALYFKIAFNFFCVFVNCKLLPFYYYMKSDKRWANNFWWWEYVWNTWTARKKITNTKLCIGLIYLERKKIKPPKKMPLRWCIYSWRKRMHASTGMCEEMKEEEIAMRFNREDAYLQCIFVYVVFKYIWREKKRNHFCR